MKKMEEVKVNLACSLHGSGISDLIENLERNWGQYLAGGGGVEGRRRGQYLGI